jgi:hypothetical protein
MFLQKKTLPYMVLFSLLTVSHGFSQLPFSPRSSLPAMMSTRIIRKTWTCQVNVKTHSRDLSYGNMEMGIESVSGEEYHGIDPHRPIGYHVYSRIFYS